MGDVFIIPSLPLIPRRKKTKYNGDRPDNSQIVQDLDGAIALDRVNPTPAKTVSSLILGTFLELSTAE
ncbi:MAG: hypothetical protein RLZZ490_60 [Cyanobacteriota bacterium]